MKLYHGTNTAVMREIQRSGLIPRAGRKTKGNWSHTVISRPDAVYLTVAYAPYFAIASTSGNELPIVIEIDTDLIDNQRLVPDEDVLEQTSRRHNVDNLPESWSMKRRTRYYRDRLHLYSGKEQWKQSLEMMGNCCYLGIVPSEAITRIALFDPKKSSVFSLLSMDPSISILNYQVVGKKYRALTKWLFGDDLGEDQPRQQFSDEDLKNLDERFKYFKFEFQMPSEEERVGIEIIK